MTSDNCDPTNTGPDKQEKKKLKKKQKGESNGLAPSLSQDVYEAMAEKIKHDALKHRERIRKLMEGDE